tara:strand:- start:52 stop:372 length:321 start_codon:yes stop_codon:yes gene_type:complete
MAGIAQTFNQAVNQQLSFLNNPYAATTLSIFLVLYGGMAAPNLPKQVASLFDHAWFRLIVLFLIGYTGNRNPMIALLVAVGLVVSMNTLSKYQVEEKFNNVRRMRY